MRHFIDIDRVFGFDYFEKMEHDSQEMIEIDGSFGEGGGQILRTSLALSVLSKRPFTVHHIRARRKKPGLGHQHLMAVQALARISGAEVEGAAIGSQKLTFIPKEIRPGDYEFRIGTAGSVTLLLQALLPPLSLNERDSRLTLMGGTHVPWSPPFHYLSEVLLPTLRTMGITVEARIETWGWYPKGGGIIHVEMKATPNLEPIALLERGSLKRIRGLSATSHLPEHVGERQRDEALKTIEKEMRVDTEITLLPDVPGNGPGSFLFLAAESEKAIAGFSSLGQRGKPAEEVAREAVGSLRDYLESDGCIDPHLADQLIPFVVMVKGHSSFITNRMSEHLLTNLWVVQHFSDVKITKSGEKGMRGKIEFFNE
jgi:RNA 3'-terminal phosphate cyclase (ATP)